MNVAVGTLGYLLAVVVTSARAQVGGLAYVDQGYTGQERSPYRKRRSKASPSSGQVAGSRESLCATAKTLSGGTQFWQ